MQLNEFAKVASVTARYPKSRGLEYLTLGLCGEVGEFANKVKKILRGDYENDDAGLKQVMKDLRSELGDCLWYLSQLPQEIGTNLEDVADHNLFKLTERAERSVIKGSGDNR